MKEKHQITRVDFHRFKAFETFTLRVRPFNILVGPNNSGKSTILAAFRILAAAIRKATSRRPEAVPGPGGRTFGYAVDLRPISVAEENIFFNYDDSEPAHVTFTLANKNELVLYFPEAGACFLIAKTFSGKRVDTTTAFKSEFNCPIGFVPILGPVDHHEPLYEKEAARLALFNYRASRNFRNIWYHYPEKFDDFRTALRTSWPGMDVERPKVDMDQSKSFLHMFCPEGRIPREIFWAGFGFQVWCQMLTHLIQAGDCSLFLIDEPDIYLHSDLQRQLLTLLRNLGPDILIATHSTEIVMEADPDEIVLINKREKQGRRIRQPSQLGEVFTSLGSNLNPILTQLAKTRRVVFVEGTDFQIIGRFAAKLGFNHIGNRSDFAVVAADGFNPERIRSLKAGMELTLGHPIGAAAIFDKDYRSNDECAKITKECSQFCDYVTIHNQKEIENFLLVPTAIDRAAAARLADRCKRTGEQVSYIGQASESLESFASEKRSFVTAQLLAKRKSFERLNSPKLDEATVNESALRDFDVDWGDHNKRLAMIPGKEAIAAINQHLQSAYKVSVTPTAIVDAMYAEEIPSDAKQLVMGLAGFVSRNPGRQSP